MFTCRFTWGMRGLARGEDLYVNGGWTFPLRALGALF